MIENERGNDNIIIVLIISKDVFLFQLEILMSSGPGVICLAEWRSLLQLWSLVRSLMLSEPERPRV